MAQITLGPAELSIIIRDATKAADEAWLNGIIAGGVSFVAQLASPLAPTVCTHWQAGVQCTNAEVGAIFAGADARQISAFATARWQGIDTQDVNLMTYTPITTPYTHAAALNLVPKEESFE